MNVPYSDSNANTLYHLMCETIMDANNLKIRFYQISDGALCNCLFILVVFSSLIIYWILSCTGSEGIDDL